MEADAFLLAQPLNEVQVALVVLHAVVAFGIGVAELEAIGVGLDPMAFQHLGDDLRHAEMLEDALVAAVRQISQLRTQAEAVAGQALAGVALAGAMDHTVHTFAGRAEGEIGGAMEQGFEVEIGALADHFDVEAVGLVELFMAFETQYLQVGFDAGNSEGEMRLIGIQHALASILESGEGRRLTDLGARFNEGGAAA